MPLTAAGSALISGTLGHTMITKPPDTLTGRVLRPFLLKGKRLEAGTEVTLDRRLAMELTAAQKLELVDAKKSAKAAQTDLTTQPAGTAKKES